LAIIYTELADPLLAYIDADIANSSTSASALLTPINYNADLFANEAKFFSGNYGFEGYIGVPGLSGTNGQQAAADFNIAWETLDPALNPALRALTSGASELGASGVYGTRLQLQDTMPLVFSYPVLPTTLNQNGSDFEVELNDGSIVKPLVAAFLPNLEHNERQTVVIIGEFGNRDLPGTPNARYPVSVRIVNDGTPLQMLSANGPVDAVGLNIASKNPYESGNGPKLVAAKLNYFSALGEGAPNANQSSLNNSGANLYGNEAQYRLRLYTSAGFSPDGIAGLLPNDFSKYFILESHFGDDSIEITETGRSYEVGNLGSIKVIGLADLGPAGTTVNDAYVEDHDNYYDIILEGDLAAIQSLQSVRMPSSGEYQAVYNPGGPGNNPDAPGAASGPFTVASEDHTTPITLDLDGSMQATYVEVDGEVLRNPWNLQPVGTLLGLAVKDTLSGQEINAYVDPDGRRFYSSFSPSSDSASNLPGDQTDLNPIDLINTSEFSEDSVINISGSISRSATDDLALQFYEIKNIDGAVTDPISGFILLPGEPGYADAAISNANLNSNQLRLADNSINSFEFTLQAGKLYAPVLINEEQSELCFAIASANRDGLDHFNGIGANGWGIEDTFGGGDRDFDDIIIRFEVSI
jgi:hypothetical protein